MVKLLSNVTMKGRSHTHPVGGLPHGLAAGDRCLIVIDFSNRLVGFRVGSRGQGPIWVNTGTWDKLHMPRAPPYWSEHTVRPVGISGFRNRHVRAIPSPSV